MRLGKGGSIRDDTYSSRLAMRQGGREVSGTKFRGPDGVDPLVEIEGSDGICVAKQP
jgi:hypothetical protein